MTLAVAPTDHRIATEEDLLTQVAAGDSGDPMVALYQRYASRLFGLGLKLLGDRGMAEEMVQETFVRLWRSADRFDAGKGSVRTFTYTIARRVCVDLRRRSASRPLNTLEDVEGGIDDGAFDALIVSLDMRDALGSLSPKHREILELHFDEDLTQPQVAERLEIPVGTVKTRTYYGLRALKAELQERGIIG